LQDQGSEAGVAVQALAPVRARVVGDQRLPYRRRSHTSVRHATWASGSILNSQFMLKAGFRAI